MIFQLATYEPHAFLIVLAVDDLSSLDTVSEGKIVLDQLNSDQADYLLGRLESSGSLTGRATILVANKTDLVRWISTAIAPHNKRGVKLPSVNFLWCQIVQKILPSFDRLYFLVVA